MRLIDADALIDDIKNHLWDWETVNGITAQTVLKQTITDVENQPTISPWHRVEDELPEPIHPTDPRYKAYLICDSLGYMHVADYTYSKHFPTCYSFHVNGEEETDVKYWMPLPEPPKEDA